MPKVFQIARTLEFPAITRALANDWVDKIGRRDNPAHPISNI